MPRVSQIQAGRYDPPTDIPFYAQRLKLERLYNGRMVERRMVEGCMRHEPNGGRAYIDPAPSSVGAGEVRASLRPRVRPNRDATGDALRDSAALDRRGMGTYRRTVAPPWLIALLGAGDAFRVMETAGRVETVDGAERRRERSARPAPVAGAGAAETYERRAALLGVDLSLADS